MRRSSFNIIGLVIFLLWQPSVYSQSQYGDFEEKKSKYGNSGSLSRYGNVSDDLDPIHTISSTPSYCIDVPKSRSPYVAAICINSLKVRWRASKLLGEPVFNYQVSYNFDCMRLRGRYGDNSPASGANSFCRSQNIGNSEGGPDVFRAFSNLKLIDLDITAEVYRYVSNFVDTSRPKHLENTRSAMVIADAGVPGRPGAQSFNVSGSPNWKRAFFQVSGLSGSRSTACREYAKDKDLAYTNNTISAEESKQIFEEGFVLREPDVCDADVSGISELNMALRNWCAVEIAKGTLAENLKPTSGHPPCRGDETASFTNGALRVDLRTNSQVTRNQLDASGAVSQEALKRSPTLSVSLNGSSSQVAIGRDGKFSTRLVLREGRNQISYKLVASGVLIEKVFTITYEKPDVAEGPLTRFKEDGLYGYKDQDGITILPTSLTRAPETLSDVACVDTDSEIMLVSRDAEVLARFPKPAFCFRAWKSVPIHIVLIEYETKNVTAYAIQGAGIQRTWSKRFAHSATPFVDRVELYDSLEIIENRGCGSTHINKGQAYNFSGELIGPVEARNQVGGLCLYEKRR